MQKLVKMRALLKQKKINEAAHKKAIMKEASIEKKRQDKQRIKEKQALDRQEARELKERK